MPTAQTYDEYDNPGDRTAATRYGRLGGKERSGDTVNGRGLRRRPPRLRPGSANGWDWAVSPRPRTVSVPW